MAEAVIALATTPVPVRTEEGEVELSNEMAIEYAAHLNDGTLDRVAFLRWFDSFVDRVFVVVFGNSSFRRPVNWPPQPTAIKVKGPVVLAVPEKVRLFEGGVRASDDLGKLVKFLAKNGVKVFKKTAHATVTVA